MNASSGGGSGALGSAGAAGTLGMGGTGGMGGTTASPMSASAGDSAEEQPPMVSLEGALEAYVAVTKLTLWSGSHRTDFFTGETQLMSGLRRTLLPPVAPSDTCSREAPPERVQVLGWGELARPEHAFLIDGNTKVRFLPPEVSGIRNLIWFTDPPNLESEPRHGEHYGFEAYGGDLEGMIESDDVVLPSELTLPQLEGKERFELANETLTWTGMSDGALEVQFFLYSDASMTDGEIVYCRFIDDGEQRLPEVLREALQEKGSGVVLVDASRTNAHLSGDGVSIYAVGQVRAQHTLAFGERCESPALVEACGRYADVTHDIEATCGNADPWPLSDGSLCPAYLAEMCESCPDLFDCQAEGLQCEDGLVLLTATCACD